MTLVARTAAASYDVAIVGSGPVGMAVVRQLARTSLRILLVEAGGKHWERRIEEDTFAATSQSPSAHYPTYMFRRRMLGGASTVWGGRCIPFDELDFEATPARAGWPIEFEKVLRRIPEALGFLEGGVADFDERDAFVEPIIIDRTSGGLSMDRIERFSKPTNVWKRYSTEIEGCPNVTVLPNTLAREVLVDDGGSVVRGLSLIDRTGTVSNIAAGLVVLACGGIETARLLLASRSTRPAGLGNEHDLVGRNYMTHLIGDVGTWAFPPDMPVEKIAYRTTKDGVYARTIIQLSHDLRRREELPNILYRPNIPPVWDPRHGSGVLSAMHFAKSVVAREYASRLNAQCRGNPEEPTRLTALAGHLRNVVASPAELLNFSSFWIRRRILADRKIPSVFFSNKQRVYPLEFNAEHYPHANSRIRLSDERDRFGMPKIRLDWVIGNDNREGIRRSLARLSERVSALGLGVYIFDPSGFDLHTAPQGGHHIGTVRMSATATTGVVDPNGELFHTRNLFVAGSAIFPTSGCANPTLLAVAMALIQADVVAARLGRPRN